MSSQDPRRIGEHPRAAEQVEWSAAYSMIHHLALDIARSEFDPQVVVALHDPEAPGGFVVASQLATLLGQHLGRAASLPVVPLTVTGRSGTRHAAFAGLPADTRQVLVVDDVSWSGSTLRSAIAAIRREANVEVRSCVLVCGQPAKAAGLVDYSSRVSAARDVTFPWGTVGPTGALKLEFGDAVRDGAQRMVEWAPRPWGYWEQFAINEECTVRILTIFPGECLSLQYHNERDEFFVALDDGVTIQIDDKKVEAKKGDYLFIPRGTIHRQFAPETHPVRILEVSFGRYDQVGDIVRLADKYGRQDRDGSI